MGYYPNRWFGYTRRTNTDEAFKVSASQLYKAGLFPFNATVIAMQMSSTYRRGNKPLAHMDMTCERDRNAPAGYRLKLDYPTPQGHRVTYVMVDKTPLPRRYWFICPACNARCGVVWRPFNATHFACRSCHDLIYASSQNSRHIPADFKEYFDSIRQYERLEKLMKKHGGL